MVVRKSLSCSRRRTQTHARTHARTHTCSNRAVRVGWDKGTLSARNNHVGIYRIYGMNGLTLVHYLRYIKKPPVGVCNIIISLF